MEPIDSPIGEEITKEMWRGKVTKWQESTITSPSCRHLGHFKALVCLFAEAQETEEGKEMYSKQEDIINAHLLGINKIHLIHILHLYKADYSLFLGLIWKELVEVFEKNGTINCGLHGGCQGHDTQTLSLIKELKYYILYSSCKSLGNFDNDAASCCDCILPNVSSLVARKKGLHKNVTFVHTTTLEEAKYCLKTVLHVSN
eukprot:13621263-Ditylum_brightwellii.AAC.1